MLAQKEEEHLYDVPIEPPVGHIDPPKGPLVRHELNTNLRNCLRAVCIWRNDGDIAWRYQCKECLHSP